MYFAAGAQCKGKKPRCLSRMVGALTHRWISNYSPGTMKKVDLEEQLKALADPVRMRIVRLLALPARSKSAADAGYCACDIGAVMGVGQSTISHHMKILMGAGLVDSEKAGRWVYYRLRQSAFVDLAACFTKLARSSAKCDEPTGDADADAGADACDAAACEPAPQAPAPRKLTVVARKR